MRALIAVIAVVVFVALLVLNTTALAELAWASLTGRIGGRAQVIGLGLAVLAAASLIAPFLRRGAAAPAARPPAPPQAAKPTRARSRRNVKPPPAERPPGAKRRPRNRPKSSRGKARPDK